MVFPCTPLVYSLGALCSFFIYILLFTDKKKKKKKEQNVVARSSAEAELRAMAAGVCELLWVKIILEDLKV